MKKFYLLMLVLCAGMNVVFAQIAAPTLNSPADGYVYPNTVKPLLKINSVSGASYYLFHWSEDSTFATYSSHTMSSSYTGLNVNGLKFGTTYYWRVYAITANYADTSAVSEVRSFTTTDAPTLTSPSDGTILSNSVRPNIRWTEITGASKYIYQCDTSSSFNSPLCLTYTNTGYSSGGSNPNQLHFGKTYYVRMKATNTNESDTSAWSEARSFTTSDAPTLTSPSDGAILSNSVRPNIRWTEITGASQYIYQCDTSLSFDSPLSITTTYTGYSSSGYNLNNLHFGKAYYLRMKAINSDDSDTSSWSAVRSFTTSDAPTLSSPSDGSTLTTIKPTLYYNTITGASGYLMQWSEDPYFATYDEYLLESSNNGLTLTRLKFATTYYWRVCALNNNSTDTSAWSEVWHFTTTNGVPTLSSPSNGSTSTVIRPTLYYNTISGAGGYLMQWSEDPYFATYDEYLLESSNNGLTLTRLKFATTYYWRVCAINNNSTDTSAWSEVWSFTTTNGVPTLSTPTDGSTLTTVQPTLYYNTISGAGGYLMQWSEDPDFATYEDYSLGSSNNGLTLNRLKFSTTYYWRVCALNNNSTDTSAWSEVWHFTTTNGIPTLSSPTNGSTLTIIKPTAYYNTISGAGGYLMQWSEDADFATYEEYSLSSSNNGLNLNRLKFATTYYWRVCSINNNSTDTSAWSEVWSFTTCGAPTLSSPSDGYVYSSSVTPTLQCTSLSGVGKYIFEWDTTATFSSPLCGSTVKTTYSTSIGPLKLGTTYYWHARITNSDDSDTSSWSTVWSFTTGGSIPTLSSPSNGSTAVRLRPTLQWNSVSSCNYYDYECDTTPNFNSTELQSGSVASGTTSIRLNQLRYGTTYYWRVRIRLNSDTSSWSTVWRFTTAGTIALTSPSNGSTLSHALTTTLDWDFINDGDYYEYQYDLSPDFNSPALVSGQVAVGTSEVDITQPLRFGETYYWRVREYTTIDTTPWSATWSFNTPATLTLVSPSNNATVNSTTVTLDWDYINGGTIYECQYDTCATFDSPSLRVGTVAVGTSELTVRYLRLGTTYYWRVREMSAVDTSEWSTVWHFTTGGGIPTLVSPSNNATAVRLRPTIDWNPISSCDYYDYECDVTPQFNSPELQSGTIAVGTSEKQLNQLRYGETYYWRVRIRVGSDTSSWSNVWHFTTANSLALVSPNDGSTLNRTVKPTLDWDYIQDGDYYEYQYDLSANFNTPDLVSGRIAVGTSEIELTNPLRFGETYYWRVREYTTLDTSDWSATWRFTTPGPLALVSPANGTTNVEASVTLDWDYIQGGTLYHYQYDKTPDFTSADLMEGTVPVGTSQATLYNLEENTLYYWRVREMSAVDTTAWSAVWHFTTRMAPIYTDIYDTVCASYTWNNHTYTASGTYQQHFVTALQADSTVTLHLIVNQPVVNETYRTACDEYEWQGETLTASGDYSVTFTAANGCDSVVTLHLTVNYPVENETDVTACDEYEWNGETLTASGDYTATFTAANGCDSVVTLHLTVNQAVENETDVTACDEYEWNGEMLTESGDYTATFTAANGCDSVVTLHLTVNQAVENETDVTACDEYEWNGETLTASGDYTATFTAANGCDSVVTLHLTINPCDTNGINENGMVNLTLYPNPTTGMVNVQCTIYNEQWENVEIQVLDVYGRLLDVVGISDARISDACISDARSASLQSVQIDLSRYATGIYFVRLVNGGKVMAVRKVVKE